MFPLILSFITFVLFLFSKTASTSIPTTPLLFFSQIASLIGAVLLSFTFILSSRFNFLEKYFGSLDKVYKQHHLYGAMAFLFLISHPLLLTLQTFSSSLPTAIYLFPSPNLVYTTGVLALYSLIIFLTFTLLIKLPYHLWYLTHQLMGIVLIFALIHINFITSDVSRFPFLKIWIIIWILLALISYLYKKFFYIRFGPKFNYQVDQVQNINGLLDLYLKAVASPLKYHPGQFIFISFSQKNISSEFHPFSLVSTPDSPLLHLAVKVIGDYTGSLIGLQKNTPATIMGPNGRLYEAFETNQDIVLIAGGIGITPFISLIESEIINPKNRQISLFYSTQNIDAAFYHQKFLELAAKNKKFEYHPTFTDSKPRLTASTISSLTCLPAGRFLKSNFLLCGPQIMMESLKNQLLDLNVASQNIYYEDFSLT
ncbi:MAG: ferric reductase-like transmembrane domain-containing protein [Candidatus Shapirobacteria bacterium]|jgi:predicted ferric reductase